MSDRSVNVAEPQPTWTFASARRASNATSKNSSFSIRSSPLHDCILSSSHLTPPSETSTSTIGEGGMEVKDVGRGDIQLSYMPTRSAPGALISIHFGFLFSSSCGVKMSSVKEKGRKTSFSGTKVTGLM